MRRIGARSRGCWVHLKGTQKRAYDFICRLPDTLALAGRLGICEFPNGHKHHMDMETGSPQMIFISASPFPYTYRDYHMETMKPYGNLFSYGDYFLNSQMVTDTIWK